MEGLCFPKAVDSFLQYQSALKQASNHTLRNYNIDLREFGLFFQDAFVEDQKEPTSFLVQQVDKRAIRSYLAFLAEKRLARKTIHRRISCLRSFFSYLMKQQKLIANPLAGLSTPKLEKKIPNPIGYQQIEQLFAQPNTQTYLGYRDRCIMELFYSSGLRLSELTRLNRRDVDIQGLLIKVHGKGKKQRMTPITKTAAFWLKTYMEHPLRKIDSSQHRKEVDGQAVFLNKWGKRLTARSIDRHFAQYLKQSGLSATITPHVIRHTIATHLLEKGMNLKAIQKFLGHNSLATTTIYTQVSSQLKREAYDKTHPLAKGCQKKSGKH